VKNRSTVGARVFALLLGGALSAHAGFISIQVGCEVKEDQLVVRVENVGDEPAQNIFATVDFQGQTHETEIAQSFPPNKPVSKSFPLDMTGLKGVYPAIVVIDFEDLNAYSFSAVSLQLARVGAVARTKLNGVLERVEMRQKAKTKLTVRNDDGKDITAKLRVVTPREITAASPAETVTVPANGITKVTIVLENLSGTPSSSYPIHALLEYDDDGTHFCETAMTTIPVLAANPATVGRFWIVLAIVVVIAAILFAPKLKKMLAK